MDKPQHMDALKNQFRIVEQQPNVVQPFGPPPAGRQLPATARQLVRLALRKVELYTQEALTVGYFVVLAGSRSANSLYEQIQIDESTFYRIKNFNHIHFEETDRDALTDESGQAVVGRQTVTVYYILEHAPGDAVNPLTGKTAEDSKQGTPLQDPASAWLDSNT
jgi:hypothetical protein